MPLRIAERIGFENQTLAVIVKAGFFAAPSGGNPNIRRPVAVVRRRSGWRGDVDQAVERVVLILGFSAGLDLS